MAPGRLRPSPGRSGAGFADGGDAIRHSRGQGPHSDRERVGVRGGASKNRTCDLILIRASRPTCSVLIRAGGSIYQERRARRCGWRLACADGCADLTRTWRSQLAVISRSVASIRTRTLTTGQSAYLVRFRGPDGVERSKQFKRKKDAERYASLVEVDLAQGGWVDPRLGRMTVEEWFDRWWPTATGLRPITRLVTKSHFATTCCPRSARRPSPGSNGRAFASGYERSPTRRERASRPRRWSRRCRCSTRLCAPR